MLDFDTAEYRRLSLLAAGVSPSYIPPILDTATWRRLLIAALINNTSTRAISGQVDYYADLPTEIGIPTIGATFLVKYSSGIYLINYKSAGVYIKVADTGSLTDWVYAPLSALSTLPDVTLTNPQVGDTLTWNGSQWVNAVPSSGSFNVQTYTPSSDVSWSSASFSQILTFNLLAGKKYFLQMNSLFRLNGGSQGRFYLSLASGGGPINYLSGVYTSYITSGPFPEPLIPLAVTNSSSNDQRFSFDCIIQQASTSVLTGSIANATLKRGSQIVLTQIN
jgi:hypothetical protein